MRAKSEIIDCHPCFSKSAHYKVGRIHLPVAPSCNIQCVYCERRFDCPNESRPGVTSRILKPEEAIWAVKMALEKCPAIRVVGIAGPGEPLANSETFETLQLVRSHFPDLMLCISTNGLLLSKSLEELGSYGVKTLTVTVNTLREVTANQLYSIGSLSAVDFLTQQQQGVMMAVNLGMIVKINTVLIPGINSDEIGEIARFAGEAGAHLMNIIPLIPCGNASEWCPPSKDEMCDARRSAGKYIKQFTHCARCRADAIGIPSASNPNVIQTFMKMEVSL